MDTEIKKPADSKVQRDIEEKAVRCLFQKKDSDLIVKKVSIQSVNFEFDYFDEKNKILCEVYAGINNLSAGSKKKIIADCFKLVFAEKLFDADFKKVLVFIDEKIKNNFERDSWIANAIREYGIELKFHKISEEEMKKLREAKEKQSVSNVKQIKS